MNSLFGKRKVRIIRDDDKSIQLFEREFNPISERLFIHKSLLFSLGVGNLVFVLDKTLFASREDHLVSEVFIIKYKKRAYQLRYFASSLFSEVQQLCFFKLKQKMFH